MQMQNQNISSLYLSNCDLINRGLILDVNQIPKVDKIIIQLSSSQNKKNENISSSDLNSHLKILLMFYFILGINPKVNYHREKNLNYQSDEKENDSSYAYKIILENSLDVQKFIHYFFVENNFKIESITSTETHDKTVSLKLVIPSILDQDIEGIFNMNSKETSIKDLNLTVNFLVNSKSMSKIKMESDLYSVFPFWFVTNTFN